MRVLAALALGLSLPALAGCATVQTAEATPAHPEARPYDPALDASAAVDAALARARDKGKLVLVAMGGNWCADSRAFAGWMESERFRQLVSEKYELVYINVGLPQTGDGFNLHIAQRFGMAKVEGTPTVLIVDAAGELLNADTAGSWRNASTREADAIYEELAGY